MKYWLFLLLTLTALTLQAQEDEELQPAYEEEEEPVAVVSTRELGIDLNFSASTFGGTGGLGVKLGFLQGEKFIVGPSIRYQQSWSDINGVKAGFAVYGGGGFAHVRLANYFFLGTEIELLSSPLQYSVITTNRKWIPVALAGGGFSRAFTENFRLNAGIMYDLVNHVDSPLRNGYFMKKENGIPIPVIYRIAFFFAI
jgi:hypothetical protein